ncbi:hypothetical protein EDC30_10840 [Paucimonas lemoignei]|uniref:Lipoprotein n=1 Tax=Paucimonas lemoignei TaxID=29443 RepID=A0A4R3HS68_PAULE|nr:hypothetical protein [Paucimonas lemoignei]TCS35977.1 hypothetical protein EDC30_10840 [Paucimonas lemoignei]
MKTSRILSLVLPAVLLCGCLEVEQHPKWVNGEYAGKRDDRPAQSHFHGDRLAWAATIANRNHLQNEYGRTGPGDVEPVGGVSSTNRSTLGVTGTSDTNSGTQESNATRPSTAAPTGTAPAQASPADANRGAGKQVKP